MAAFSLSLCWNSLRQPFSLRTENLSLFHRLLFHSFPIIMEDGLSNFQERNRDSQHFERSPERPQQVPSINGRYYSSSSSQYPYQGSSSHSSDQSKYNRDNYDGARPNASSPNGMEIPSQSRTKFDYEDSKFRRNYDSYESKTSSHRRYDTSPPKKRVKYDEDWRCVHD